ncbi:21020_t:CDS:1 [Entrophospora sp. SA101]|nr:9864_t:CDS:1 [Entrophospora sp. SA101]CAJ0746987.1 21020_t:CDS:1 [Entrophospora sp. SA101]CAJ0841973.1 10699_t:CDS:1 [Entrophospora sp. SA101]CAJ0908610.1 13466_t:CDS:1 [Entrophospora sp. SA101]
MANEVYQITERDFLNMVRKPHCLGTEKRNGKAEEGHEKCNICKGNYFVGGECNYGGRHLMDADLNSINKNFAQFGELVSKQIEISQSKNEKEFNKRKARVIGKFQELESKCNDDEGKSLLRGSCIGLDGTETAFNKKVILLLRDLARQLREYIEATQNSTWEMLQAFNNKLDELDKMQAESTRLAKS